MRNGLLSGTVLGYGAINLDATEEGLRFKETALGTYMMDCMQAGLSDVMAKFFKAGEKTMDFCIVGGAGVSGKFELKAGVPITIKTLMQWVPKMNEFQVLELTGQQILELLNKGVGPLPEEAGGFPQTSSTVRLSINMISHPPSVCDVFIHGRPLDTTATYNVGMDGFMSSGKVVKSFADAPRIIDDDFAVSLGNVITDDLKAKTAAGHKVNTAVGRYTVIGDESVTRNLTAETDLDAKTKELFLAIDVNNDGSITPNEFRRWLPTQSF